VALNLGDAPARAEIGAGARVLLSTHLDREGEEAGPRVALRPQEGVILEIGA
jgi:alpha-glucosidase